MSARRIAIVGSGQAALLAAHGLARQGHEVTLYSDRTADRWLNGSRPTGTAARFDLALAFERELGLAHWEETAPKIEGVHLTFCPTLKNRLVTLTGRVPRGMPAFAIDLRLQSHRWMNDRSREGRRARGRRDGRCRAPRPDRCRSRARRRRDRARSTRGAVPA